MPKRPDEKVFTEMLWNTSVAALETVRPVIGRAYQPVAPTLTGRARRWLLGTEVPQRYRLADVRVPLQHTGDMHTRLHELELTGASRTRYLPVELPYAHGSTWGGQLTLSGFWEAELQDGVVTAAPDPALFHLKVHTSRDTTYSSLHLIEDYLYDDQGLVEATNLQREYAQVPQVPGRGMERILGFLGLVQD